MKKTISLILTTAIICSIISFTSLVPNVSAATTNTIYSEGFNNLTVDSDITSQLSPSWWKYFSLKSKSAITNPNPSEVALIKNVSVGNNKLTIGQTSTVISPLEYTGDGFRMNTDFTATDVYTPAQSVDVRDYKLVYELDTAVAANANGGFREFKFYLTIPSVEDTTANSQTGPDANNYYYYNISQKFIDSKWYKPSNTLAGFTIAQYKFNSVFDWKFYANNNSTSAYCADGTSYQSGKANETSLANTLNRVKLEVIVKEGGVSKNVYRLFFNGIQMGGDYSMTNAISATNKFVGGIGFAPSTTSNVLTSVDNINVYTVSKSYGEATAILNNTFENTTDIANDGYTLATNSSSGILTYNSSFGRNKYANVTSTTAIPSVSKNITVNLPTNTLEDYKTVFIADVLAKPGSKFEVKQADGSSAFSILFNQSDNEIILNSSSGSRPLKLYNSNQWYRFRIDLSAIKNNAEAKTMDVYIDNSLMFSDIACQYTTLGSINFSGIQNSSVSFDNVNVTGVYGSYDILDNTKMMYEIQMADNLIKYYETEQLSNKPLSQYYFIDSVQTANIKYMGATNYNNYKNALAQAKELYYSATSMTQINAKIDEMWSYVSEIGGEIRELYFNDGILNGFTGKAVLVKDELPIMSYGLKVSGDGDFIFPKTGISNVDGFNVSTLGNGCEVQIDFDTKISDTTGVVTYAFGDKDGNSAIQLRLNGTTKAVELLSGATWNTIQSGIEANKWYNIKVTLRITNGGNTYNGFYKVLIDGVEKQAYTAYLNTVKYINRASVIGATDNNTVLIDNFKVAKLIAKDAPTYTLNEKGALISEIRQGQIKLNQYTSGNEPGQCSTDTYNNLKTITNLAVDRYNQKTMRITNSTAIPTNITNVTSAINALVINPYNDFYLDSIRYKDSQNNTVFSPV